MSLDENSTVEAGQGVGLFIWQPATAGDRRVISAAVRQADSIKATAFRQATAA